MCSATAAPELPVQRCKSCIGPQCNGQVGSIVCSEGMVPREGEFLSKSRRLDARGKKPQRRQRVLGSFVIKSAVTARHCKTVLDIVKPQRRHEEFFAQSLR